MSVELQDYLIADANHKFAEPFISNAKQQTEFNFRKLRILRFVPIIVFPFALYGYLRNIQYVSMG